MIDSYSETRVILTPSGEIFLALPIYSNESGALFNSEELKSLIGDGEIPANVSVGMYEHMGFLLYHPDQPFSFYMRSIELFEDLGKL